MKSLWNDFLFLLLAFVVYIPANWLGCIGCLSLSFSVCVRLLTAGQATGVCWVVWPELWSPASSCWDPARIQHCCRQTPAPSATHYTHTHIKYLWESQWHVDEASRDENKDSLWTRRPDPRSAWVMKHSSGVQYRHWSRSLKGFSWFHPCISVRNVPNHEIKKHFWIDNSFTNFFKNALPI